MFLVLFSSCGEDVISGCMDVSACNYDSAASEDNGTCDYSCIGCTDSEACNFSEEATEDDGGCQYEDLDDPIKIVYVDDIINGSIGEELIAHIHVQNATCQDISDLVVRKFNFTSAEVYFCFNDICFPQETDVSPNPLTLSSFETDDYFKGYLTADNAGTYEVTYRFYLQNNPQTYKSVVVTYNVN